MRVFARRRTSPVPLVASIGTCRNIQVVRFILILRGFSPVKKIKSERQKRDSVGESDGFQSKCKKKEIERYVMPFSRGQSITFSFIGPTV